MTSRLVETFPGLGNSHFRITSPSTEFVDEKYNCIAWAAGDTTRWWQPDSDNMYYWPANANREYTLQAYINSFQAIGYQECDDSQLEVGYDKICLFVNDEGIPTHAARLLPNGYWTSKVGNWEDIEHELRALEGKYYGRIACFMRRPVERL